MSDDDLERRVPPSAMSIAKLKLGRRAFIVGCGTAPLLLSGAASGQATEPVFKRNGSRIELAWGAGPHKSLWRLDQGWFSSSSAIKFGQSEISIDGYFAGTNLLAAFKISIRKQSGRWGIKWAYEGNLVTWIDLESWFAGTGFPIEIKRTSGGHLPKGSLAISGARTTAILRYPFTLDLRPMNAATIDFTLGADTGKTKALAFTVFDDDPTSDASADSALTRHVATLLPEGVTLKTRTTLDSLVLGNSPAGWAAGEVGGSTLRLQPALPKIIVETVQKTNGQMLIVQRRLADGESRLKIGKPDPARTMLVTQLELIDVVGGGHGLALMPSRRPKLIQGRHFAAIIRGTSATFHRDFRRKDRITLPVVLQVLHVRGGDNARYDVDFRRYRENGDYLERSALLWPNGDVEGVEAWLSVGLPDLSQFEGFQNRLCLGAHSRVDVAMFRNGADGLAEDSPVLRVRRHQDAFDLGFLFYAYRLVVSNGVSLLKPDLSPPGQPQTAQRAVRFHPQHLLEEVFTEPENVNIAPMPGAFDILRDHLDGVAAVLGLASTPAPSRVLGQRAMYAAPGYTTRLARTRASGPSRIVFKAGSGTPPDLALTVDALTDWRQLELAVSGRAVGDLPLDDQLARLGIGTHTGITDAQALVRRSLHVPSASETALELVTGLIFSPDNSARFRTPRRTPDDASAVWTAQLELSPLATRTIPVPAQARVRAIWATGLDPQTLIPSPEPVKPKEDPADPFNTSLSPDDRIQLVMLSSAFGLGALRALTRQGQDVPQSMVRLPREKYEYLEKQTVSIPGDTSGGRVLPEGVMSPLPFTRFGARLTGFGADIDLEWQGEPAGPLPTKPFFAKPFSIERYLHRTSLGSDIFVEVVYKGFLFPYGFRVSLIKVTEREAWSVASMGAMMPAIQRFFILPKPVEKTFPGIYQPFEGREIPVRHARLISEPSVELDQASMGLPPGFPSMSPAPGIEPGQVFWPRAKAGQTLIHFEFEADDTGVRRSAPMLFLDNIAVKNPATVRATLEYYNTLADVQHRTENHHGGRTVFAPSTTVGDTAFETDHIVLKARSRMVEAFPGAKVTQDTPYEMDAFMEGADEPPFYPVMVLASIHVQPLDRLLGEPQGLQQVGFNGNYLRKGFDPRGNAAELFLNFLDGNRVMNLSGRGEVSGGLSQTPTPIAGLSRSNAIVGAKAKALVPAVAAAKGATPTISLEPPVGSDWQTPWDLSEVVNNEFNPGSFFKGAKLLGVIGLEEVVQAATMEFQPKLKEVYDYTLGTAGNGVTAALEALKGACGIASAAVIAALVQAETALSEFLEGEARVTSPMVDRYPNLRRFYPDLTQGLEGLAYELVQSVDLASLPKFASGVQSQWREVSTTVDAVIANPSPEPLRKVLGELRTVFDKLHGSLGKGLREAVQEPLKAFQREIINPLLKSILDACFTDQVLTNLYLFDAFFGALRPPPTEPPTLPAQFTRDMLQPLVDDLLKNPSNIPAAVLAAPLADAFTLPLLRMMADMHKLAEVVDLKDSMVTQVAQIGASALHSVIQAIASGQVLVQIAGQAASDMCKAVASAAKPLVQVAELALQAVPLSGAIVQALKVIDERLLVLSLPNLGASPQIDAVREANAGLRTAVQQVARLTAEVESQRTLFAAGLDAFCETPGKIPAMIAGFIDVRARVLSVIDGCAEQALLVSVALGNLAAAQSGEAIIALQEVLRELALMSLRFTLAKLVQAPNEPVTELASRLDRALGGLDPRVPARIAAVRSRLFELGKELNQLVADREARPNPPGFTVDDLRTISTLAHQLALVERTLLASLTDFTALPPSVRTQATALVAGLAGNIGTPLIKLHSFVLELADDSLKVVEDAPDLILLLAATPLAQLKMARAALSEDLVKLQDVVKAPEAAITLLARWNDHEKGLVITARVISELFNAVARGQIGAIFNLSDAKRAIEDAVRRLVPSRVTLSYQWNAKLKPVTQANPIFRPRKNAALKDEGDENLPDLVIDTRIDVDLLQPKDRSMSISGTLQPFTLHLLGNSVDLIRIGFTDTRFGASGGSAPKFSTRIATVQTGQALQFLKLLEPFMAPGGRGFYITPNLDPPGVLVGFSFSAPQIQLGTLTIINTALDISALLPFNDSQAIFRFAFASRERPFGLIVAPCYYGGGFVALTASARGIVAFEIQLEFGAATDITFGPLSAQGRVSSGIYLFAKVDGTQRLEGFVHAVGEGQIACFGISVNIEVKIVHDNSTGSIKGAATYRFSFRVGLVSVGYSVKASYNIASGSAKVLAAIGVPEKLGDWLAYRAHFVEQWPGL
ncbi:MAG: hypothetical protein ACRCTL_09830 [Pseudomonas sp.]